MAYTPPRSINTTKFPFLTLTDVSPSYPTYLPVFAPLPLSHSFSPLFYPLFLPSSIALALSHLPSYPCLLTFLLTRKYPLYQGLYPRPDRGSTKNST